jgi:BMFP domain-containing protein YqiC
MLKKLTEKFIEYIPSSCPPTVALKKEWGDWFTQKLSHHGFIPREEFEVQSQVLARTRRKIEALETRIMLLEASLQTKN